MLLRRALTRELKRGKWSLIAALVGLVVAVASVTSVHLLNVRVEQNLEALQPFDLPATVARKENGARISLAEYGELEERVARGQAPRVEALIPIIEGPFAGGWRMLGIDWVSMLGARNGWGARSDVDMTRLLTDPAVLTPQGGSLSQLASLQEKGLLVLGSHTASDDRLLLADIATASEVLGDEEISALALVIAPEPPALIDLLDRFFVGLGAAVTSRIDQDLLGPGYIISTPDEELPVRRFVRSIMFNLGVLSVLCLLVAGFIAYQSAAGMALRRAPLVNRLHSLGTDRRQINQYVYRESAALGVLACLVGLPLGLGLATLLLRLGGMGGLDQDAFDLWLIVKAVLVGVGVSLAGTLLAEPRVKRPRFSASSFGIATLAILAGVFLGLAGAFLILGGAFVLMIQLAWAMLHWVSRFSLADWRLRARQVLRGACRQGLELFPVVSAFVLALAVALAMQLMVAGLKRDFDAFLDLRLDGDLSLSADSQVLTPAFVYAIANSPSVRSVRVSETANARIGALRIDVRLIDYTPDALARYGADSATPFDAVLINGQLARQTQDSRSVRLTSEKGQAPLRVARVFNDFGAPGPRLVMSRRLGSEFFGDTHLEAVRIGVEPGRQEELRSRIEAQFGLRSESTAELRERARHMLDETFWVSDALSAVALLVAVFGVLTGFNQLHLTRLREFRLLRAVGLSNRQLLLLLAGQSTTLAGLMLPFALTLALMMNWVLCQQVNPMAFGFSIHFHIDWRQMLLFASLGVLVVVLAALVPWRMTREVSHVATTDETF